MSPYFGLFQEWNLWNLNLQTPERGSSETQRARTHWDSRSRASAHPSLYYQHRGTPKSGEPPKGKHTLQHPENTYAHSSAHSLKILKTQLAFCLLRAFLFWLDNESVEEIENKNWKSSSPLAQIRLAQAHTSAWQRSTPYLQLFLLFFFSFSSLYHTWHHAGIILPPAWQRLTMSPLSEPIRRALMQ